MAEKSELRGKVVVISGASSGFGKGTAIALARGGANVVLAARSGELLESVADQCVAAGGQALAVATDVSDRAAVESLSEQAI